MALPLITPFGTFPLVLQPPYTLTDAACTAFAMTAPASGIEQLVDTTFSWAQPSVTVEPMTIDWLGVGGVMLVFASYAAASASGPATGTFSYNEMAVFVPVWVSDQKSKMRRPMLHIAYIYPDLVLPLAAGQMVYGMPKKPARFTLPDRRSFVKGQPITAEVFAASTLSSPWSDQQLFQAQISTTNTSSSTGDARAQPPEDVSDKVRSFFGVPLVTFKQLTDAGNPPDGTGLSALYRAVITLKSPITKISLFDPFFHGIDASFSELATEPLYEVLGATPKVLFGGTFTMSFDFDPGEVLHEVFSRGGAASTAP